MRHSVSGYFICSTVAPSKRQCVPQRHRIGPTRSGCVAVVECAERFGSEQIVHRTVLVNWALVSTRTYGIVPNDHSSTGHKLHCPSLHSTLTILFCAGEEQAQIKGANKKQLRAVASF